LHPARIEKKIVLDLYKADRSSPPTWYFNSYGLEGPFKLRIVGTDLRTSATDPGFDPDVVAGLIQFLADWAALGARGQMGFGVVRTLVRQRAQALLGYAGLNMGTSKSTDLPALDNMFFARVRPKPPGKLAEKDTFSLKYDIRRLFAANRELRHLLMGTVAGDDRVGAKIAMSRPYSDGTEIRLWGWIPWTLPSGVDRERDVLTQIYDLLTKKYILQCWRECDSGRDTVCVADRIQFLGSLLEQSQ
jgi:CRISPR-associated protein Cmr1